MKVIELHRSVTESNDKDALALSKELKEKGIFFINLMSAAGSGKTTLLSKTIIDLKDKYNIAVLEADIEADVDAKKIEELGATSIQVHTDGMCHMDAGMTRTGLEEMGLHNIDIENRSFSVDLTQEEMMIIRQYIIWLCDKLPSNMRIVYQL